MRGSLAVTWTTTWDAALGGDDYDALGTEDALRAGGSDHRPRWRWRSTCDSKRWRPPSDTSKPAYWRFFCRASTLRASMYGQYSPRGRGFCSGAQKTGAHLRSAMMY